MSSELTTECEIAAWEQSGFDATNNIIFCHQFKSNDYLQVFMIAILIYLIYLGMYFLPFSSYGSYATAINEARTTITSFEGRENLRVTIDETNERELQIGRFNGMPFGLYLFFYSSLSLIYLLIKLVLIINPWPSDADNRYKNVNQRFKNGFKQFVNAETIILTYLLIHNLCNTNITKLTKLYVIRFKKGLFSAFSKYIILLFLLIIWIDFIASIVLLCYKWSLLIFFLYEIAVGIIVILLLIITCCFTIPCLLCFLIIDVTLFAMCGQNGCTQFVMTVGAAIIIAIFGYFVICVLLCFMFLFVDGPYDAVIYLNGDNPNHMAVLILFIIATCFGVLAVLAGAIYGCLDPSDHQTLPNNNDEL